ncbi:hypothetical protein [Leptospira interrogans]|uniref:hypothetical protein n=1 Tax=Leptospira interrogans TaxID=173 RepID=UPI000A4BB85A|nr:hypothetical protein [Leptospira interrogans]
MKKFKVLVQKFYYVLFFFLFFFPVNGEDSCSVLRFDTEEEYVDFYYALEPALRQIYPKITIGWIRKNTSAFESDLENIILLANRDYNYSKKVSTTQMTAEDLGPMIASVISEGVVVFAKRKNTKSNESIWIVVIGFLDNGKKLIVNDSKADATLEISSQEISVGYYFSVLSNKPVKKI